MDWTETIARVIALNTFSSVWYWLTVIVSWSVASNWLIGIPFDMLFRARKVTEPEAADLEALVDINVRRIVFFEQTFGPWIIALVTFVLSGLGMMGFFYQFELAQGLFFLAAPMTVVLIINLRFAHELSAVPLHGKALVRRLFVVRLWTQVIAMLALFFTAMYGMYFNLDKLLSF